MECDVSPFVTPIQELQFVDKYARWNPTAKRRETWDEAVDRVIDFFIAECDPTMEKLGAEEWITLRNSMLEMRAMPSMRIVQMAGPALARCQVGAYNCAYLPIDCFQSFGELLYILMQGTGCGFSVERSYIDQLPPVEGQHNRMQGTHVIPDTTEGWCDALVLGLEVWAGGGDIVFDSSQIRPQGAVLRTKGGRASGPEPLKQLLDFARGKVVNRAGGRLSSLDAHDIACFCGQIVQVGGVRRAAEISLSDFEDREMREAKTGSFWLQNPQRAMANNSVVYEEKPGPVAFLEEWTALVGSGTGERGIFNRQGAVATRPWRREPAQFGVNPCGEIMLRPREFCNLSIAIARPGDTPEELGRKVQTAAVFGTLQSMLTRFNYIRPEWKENCEEERLLGVDITGQMDCEILRPTNPDDGFTFRNTRSYLLDRLRDIAIRTNWLAAEKLGVEPSVAVTCIKPSGNSAQLFNCSSGLHPRYAPFYIRRLRIGAYTPVGKLLKKKGVPWHPEVGQTAEGATVLVFEYPVASPAGAVTRHDMSAISQLENWLEWKRLYTEHNPSVTIYVEPDEWVAVGAWVWEHWKAIGGLSFLPKDGGLYNLAPYEEVEQGEYEQRMKDLPVVDFSELEEVEDMTEVNREFACTGDRCEL
jgi:ribonucleoside-triphosphate reductase